MASKILSPEQHGFVKGHSIGDYICVASEAINMFPKRSFGGNLLLKFDTIEWYFMLSTVRVVGCSHILCKLIHSIFLFAKLYFLLNGKSMGFFQCICGVH